MKKFLYHYLNIIIAAIQCYIGAAIIWAFTRYEWDLTNAIVIILMFGIPNFIVSLIDAWIRKMDYFGMTIFAFFLSPMPRVMEISAVPPVPTIKPRTPVAIR